MRFKGQPESATGNEPKVFQGEVEDQWKLMGMFMSRIANGSMKWDDEEGRRKRSSKLNGDVGRRSSRRSHVDRYEDA